MEINRKKILRMLEKGEISLDEAYRSIKGGIKPNKESMDISSENNTTLYFNSEWNLSERAIESSFTEVYGNVIVFCKREVSFKEINKQKNSSNHIILVRPGSCFRKIGEFIFEINPCNENDYILVMNEIESKGIIPDKIIHMWSDGSYSNNEKEIKFQLELGIYSILYLTKALYRLKHKGSIRLIYVHNSGEDCRQPLYMAVSGFVRTAVIENPKLMYSTLGIPGDNDSAFIIDTAFRELQLNNGKEIEVIYKDKKRVVKSLTEVDLEDTAENMLPVKDGGVYLITGGTSGLGFIFAEYLANKSKSKLVLVGRSKLNHAISEKISKLESMGAEILYISADISNKNDVMRVVSRVKNKFKEINGVIHSAGVLQDSLIINKNAGDMKAVLAPKVFGTVFLNEETKNENLDFFVMFSSTASVLGNPGQSDYAYANSFMDCFSKLRSVNGYKGRSLSINWPLWKDGGMQVKSLEIDLMKKNTGVIPLGKEAGVKAFETGLKHQCSQFMLFDGDIHKIRNVLQQRISTRLTHGENIKDKEHIEIDVNEKSVIKSKIEEYLKGLLSKEINLPESKIKVDEAFERYGIDSVIVMDLTRELESIFGELSKTLFFEYRNIAELAEYFVENHFDKAYRKLGLPSTYSVKKSIQLDRAEKNLQSFSRKRFIRDSELPDSRKNSLTDEIAIIGVSGRFPKANNLEEYWENLKDGRECITEIPDDRWEYRLIYHPNKGEAGKSYCKWGGFIEDADKFDPLFFNISPVEAEHMDPQERIFLETVWHTLEDAGYTSSALEKSKVGVFVGVMYGHYQLYGAQEFEKGNPLSVASSFASIANRVSYYFDFKGPSISLDTMCSSSLVSVHLACESIRRGECTLAVAGGVNLSIHPLKYVLLSQGNFVSSDGKCHSLGEGGDGYVPGEGVGALLLKPLKNAIEDRDFIYAVIKGNVINHNGRTNGFMVPSPNAQSSLISEALEKFNINPRTISYIEAQATGTTLGDTIEMTGLMKAYSEKTKDRQYCSIGSVKANIGHLESASGIAAITKVLLQMKHKQLVPSINSEKLNPNINFNNSPFYVQHELTEWNQLATVENGIEKVYPRRAGINAFGAGGTNVHIILEEYQDKVCGNEFLDGDSLIIVLSARNEERLKLYAEKFISYLEMRNNPSVEELKPKKNYVEYVKKDLVRIMSDLLSIKEEYFGVHENIDEYGVNQMMLAELSARIAQTYRINLEPGFILGNLSINDIARELCYHFESRIETKLGKSFEAVEESIKMEQKAILRLEDISYTMQVGREAMEERLALIVSDISELIENLKKYVCGEKQINKFYKTNSEGMDSLLDGNVGESFIESLAKNRELEKLAKLWVAGLDIDWKVLYTNKLPRRLPLPLYPFAKERYWIFSKDNHYDADKLHYVPTDVCSINERKQEQEIENHSYLNIERSIVQILGKLLKLPENKINPGGKMRKYGLDSLSGMRMVNSINEMYEIKIPIRKFAEFECIYDIVLYILEHTGCGLKNAAENVEEKKESIKETTREVKEDKLCINDRERLAQFKTGLSEFMLRELIEGTIDPAQAIKLEMEVIRTIENEAAYTDSSIQNKNQGLTPSLDKTLNIISGEKKKYFKERLSAFILVELQKGSITPKQAIQIESIIL